MTAPKPRRTNNQPRHKGKKPARPHSSEVTPTQDEEDKQKQKKKPLQNSKEAEAPKIQKTRTQNRTNPKNARNKTQVGEKEGSSPNTKTTNKQQERVPYIFQLYLTNTCTVNNKKSSKKKTNNNFAQKTFSQSSPKGKENHIVVVSLVPFQAHLGPWGEEKTEDEKEEEQGEG